MKRFRPVIFSSILTLILVLSLTSLTGCASSNSGSGATIATPYSTATYDFRAAAADFTGVMALIQPACNSGKLSATQCQQANIDQTTVGQQTTAIASELSTWKNGDQKSTPAEYTASKARLDAALSDLHVIAGGIAP